MSVLTTPKPAEHFQSQQQDFDDEIDDISDKYDEEPYPLLPHEALMFCSQVAGADFKTRRTHVVLSPVTEASVSGLPDVPSSPIEPTLVTVVSETSRLENPDGLGTAVPASDSARSDSSTLMALEGKWPALVPLNRLAGSSPSLEQQSSPYPSASSPCIRLKDLTLVDAPERQVLSSPVAPGHPEPFPSFCQGAADELEQTNAEEPDGGSSLESASASSGSLTPPTVHFPSKTRFSRTIRSIIHRTQTRMTMSLPDLSGAGGDIGVLHSRDEAQGVKDKDLRKGEIKLYLSILQQMVEKDTLTVEKLGFLAGELAEVIKLCEDE